MSAIGPGDFVECVDARRGRIAGRLPLPASEALVASSVYRVAAVFDNPVGEPCCWLDGHYRSETNARGDGPWGYGVGRFRPIYRPKDSLIEGLLKPADAPADLQGVAA